MAGEIQARVSAAASAAAASVSGTAEASATVTSVDISALQSAAGEIAASASGLEGSASAVAGSAEKLPSGSCRNSECGRCGFRRHTGISRSSRSDKLLGHRMRQQVCRA